MNIGPEPEPTECGLVLRVVERSQAKAGAIRGRADRPHRIADVADAVVPEAEHAIGRRGGDGVRQRCTGVGVECGEGGLAGGGAERLVEYAQRGNPGGKVAGGEVAAVELAGFDHGQQVGCLAAAVDDVVGDA